MIEYQIMSKNFETLSCKSHKSYFCCSLYKLFCGDLGIMCISMCGLKILTAVKLCYYH